MGLISRVSSRTYRCLNVSVPRSPSLKNEEKILKNSVDDKENQEPAGEKKAMKRFFSWNVNGARALVKKKEHFAFIQNAAKNQETACFGLQETKCDASTLPKEFEGKKLGFHKHFLNSSATKKGYSGT